MSHLPSASMAAIGLCCLVSYPASAQAAVTSSVPTPQLAAAITAQPVQCTSPYDALASFHLQLLQDDVPGFAGSMIDESTGDQILTLVKLGVPTRLHIRFHEGCWTQQWETQI